MRVAAAKWFSRPHGEPSGVCTGHMKPQDSGSSLRTAVVRSVAKYAPRCTERKWLMYRNQFSFSATTCAARVRVRGVCLLSARRVRACA